MTTSKTKDPELIAAELTEAQRRAIVSATFAERAGAWHPEGWYAAGDRRVRYALCCKGLARDYLRFSNLLTPLGERVRRILQDQSHDR